MTEMEHEKVREIANSCEQKLGEIKCQTLKSKEENNGKMGCQNIKKYYIHNQFKSKNGQAMLKINKEKYLRVPIIQRFKFNKYTRRWTKKYFIQSMEEWASFEEFIGKNKDTIIEGRKNIITAKRIDDKIKKENMRI